ncbi:MAG: hypothetical protein ACI97A_001033 [Planctomycetota bacterium]|jgi:hypothetical protein
MVPILALKQMVTGSNAPPAIGSSMAPKAATEHFSAIFEKTPDFAKGSIRAMRVGGCDRMGEPIG